MKKFVFLFFFGTVSMVFSQEETLLKGQLVFSSMNTSAINIVNLSTRIGTTNNSQGEFSIAVRLGDELLFSSVQYEPYRLLVTQEIFEKPWVLVKLMPAVNELKAVTISNIDLSGSLNTDMNSVKTQKYYNNVSFGIPMPAPKPTVEERRLYTATTGGPGIIPLTLILNAISGRLKMLKKLDEFAKKDRLIEKARQTMTTDFFVSECGIPEMYISSFLYFCAEDDNFKNRVEQNHKLQLVEFFKEKSLGYKENRGW